MKTVVLLVGLATAVAFVNSASATSLIVNGDFSNPNYAGGWGEDPVPGWTNLTDTGVEVGYSPIYGLPTINSGGQNLEVNANTFGTVVQTVTGLTVGDKYGLFWDYGGRPGGGPQQLDVSFGGAQVAVDSGSFGYWTPNYVEFTASSTSEVLQFASVNVGGIPSYGNEVTNVALNAVPEPSTWALMLIGFAGLGYGGYRKARNGRIAFIAA
jgi:hypothetical protein